MLVFKVNNLNGSDKKLLNKVLRTGYAVPVKGYLLVHDEKIIQNLSGKEYVENLNRVLIPLTVLRVLHKKGVIEFSHAMNGKYYVHDYVTQQCLVDYIRGDRD